MKGQTVEATVTLTLKQTSNGEPGVQADEIVEAWLQEAHAVNVYVENEHDDADVTFDLDKFTVVEAVLPA